MSGWDILGAIAAYVVLREFMHRWWKARKAR